MQGSQEYRKVKEKKVKKLKKRSTVYSVATGKIQK